MTVNAIPKANLDGLYCKTLRNCMMISRKSHFGSKPRTCRKCRIRPFFFATHITAPFRVLDIIITRIEIELCQRTPPRVRPHRSLVLSTPHRLRLQDVYRMTIRLDGLHIIYYISIAGNIFNSRKRHSYYEYVYRFSARFTLKSTIFYTKGRVYNRSQFARVRRDALRVLDALYRRWRLCDAFLITPFHHYGHAVTQ